jgi:hypothetical protein
MLQLAGMILSAIGIALLFLLVFVWRILRVMSGK